MDYIKERECCLIHWSDFDIGDNILSEFYGCNSKI